MTHRKRESEESKGKATRLAVDNTRSVRDHYRYIRRVYESEEKKGRTRISLPKYKERQLRRVLK